VMKRLFGLTLLALVVMATPACAQSAEIEALRKEIADLREDLASLRSSLGRARPIIDLTAGHQKGNEDALVALIEFSDYECPFCIRHSRETMPLIEKNYIATGKILYGFRDFPIDQLHPQAIRAHEAAQCAGDQNKYWEMHSRMFGQPVQHTPESLEATATQIGLDIGTYRACVSSGKHTAAIRASVALAESFGANGTPGFFIGIIDKTTNTVKITRAISGAVPFAQFAQAIEGALAQAKK
jgi:protein-disulfide isomerase